MKNVLLFAEYGTRNGGENSLLAVLPFLKEQGFRFRVALPCPSEMAAAIEAIGLPTVPIRFFENGTRKPLEEIRSDLRKVICAENPELIHCNSLNMGRMLGPVLNAFQIPAVTHLRDILKLKPKAVADLNCFDRLIAVSDATAQFHCQQGLNTRAMTVVLNGIDLQTFSPRAKSYRLHQQISARHNDLIALSIGQIGMRKGWGDLLGAVERLPSDLPTVHFVIVGERHSTKDEAVHYENDLLERSRTRSLCGRVHFVGKMNAIHELMNDADFLIHPARQEPLGRVLIEAAASGLPVIATDVGGTKQIFSANHDQPTNLQANKVGDGSDLAILVPAKAQEELAQAIETLVVDAGKRRQMAVSVRKMAENRFCDRLSAERLASVYDSSIVDPVFADRKAADREN